jgi:DsbC/DsbD-like thiol-disulfide interchange protein
MTFVKRILAVLALAVAASDPAAAGPGGASPWAQGFHSRARLIAGGEEGGRLLTGVEIALDKGFKTYWRNAGEAGLPPRFDWSGSANAGVIEVRWPAPALSRDAGGVAYGYHEKVILPVLVKPTDPGRPVKLKLTVEYGVCKDICIPAHAEMSLTLSGAADHRPVIEQALSLVPKPRPLAADGPLSILEVRPVAGDKPSLAVRVRAPDGSRPALFPEGPENWYLSSTPAPERDTFTVTVDERPKDAKGDVPLRFTLVAGDRAIETELRLDAGLSPR